MKPVRLIHWSQKEARERAKILRAGGFEAHWTEPKGLSFLRELREDPPAAIVIDLSRLPMQGRDIGPAIRHQAATRSIPLVFVGGEEEKVARVKGNLPDAVFTTWEKIGIALKRAIANPPLHPVVPSSPLAGYSGTPLPKKLGIKPNSVVGLVKAPKAFERALTPMPEGARAKRSSSIAGQVALWIALHETEENNAVRPV